MSDRKKRDYYKYERIHLKGSRNTKETDAALKHSMKRIKTLRGDDDWAEAEVWDNEDSPDSPTKK